MANLHLSTPLIKPNFCILLPHRRSTTVSLETTPSFICYLMGDFNLNLMNHQCHSVTGEFLDALYSNMFFPLITHPTRITCHSATLIDNIFVNQFFDRSRSGLFFTDISDHLPIFSIHFDTTISASNETVFVRDVNQVNTTKFLSHLERIDWSQYATFDDPNNAYNSFFKQYSTA